MIYNDKQSNSDNLLAKANSASIRHRNTQYIAIQMYMVAHGMSPDIMSEIFQPIENAHYHLRRNRNLLQIQFTVFIMDPNPQCL